MEPEVSGDKLLGLVYNLLGKRLSRVVARVGVGVLGLAAIPFALRQINGAVEEAGVFTLEGLGPGGWYILLILPVTLVMVLAVGGWTIALVRAVWYGRPFDNASREKEDTLNLLRQMAEDVTLPSEAHMRLEAHLEYLERPQGLRGWWVRRRAGSNGEVHDN